MTDPAPRADLEGPPPADAAVLSVGGVVKRYGAKTVLDGVDLVLAPGEVRGLVGANGAGKTTLLRVILGLVGRDAGTIAFDGGVPIGSLVEEPSFYPYLSARDNLELLAKLDRGAGSERIDGVLDRVGLGDSAADRVGGFSSGMRQRLGLAAALMRGPRLLLLDEPTSALDRHGVAETVALIRRLADEDGVTTLIASHQADMLDGLVDQISHLEAGRISPVGTG